VRSGAWRHRTRRLDPQDHIRGDDAVERARQLLQRPIALRPDRLDDGLDLLAEAAQVGLGSGQQCGRDAVGFTQIVQTWLLWLLHGMPLVPQRAD
jgi:hypothetical protein